MIQLQSFILSIVLMISFIWGNSYAHEPVLINQGASNTLAGDRYPEVIFDGHPLSWVKLKLRHAAENYSNGHLQFVKEDLEQVTHWLDLADEHMDPKMRQEINKLRLQVRELYNAMNDASEEQQNILARLWHRSVVLLEREMDRLSHSWNEVESANSTMKSLIDAKMHFYYAEYDLFEKHNTTAVIEELDKSLYYIDKAYQTASPAVKKQIMKIRKDITTLQLKGGLASKQHYDDTLSTLRYLSNNLLQ